MRYLIGVLLLLFVAGNFDVDSQGNEENTQVKWYSIEEALKKSRENPKKIFIDIYTDWCGWCKRMDKNTFSHPVIAKYLNKYFYPVKFDAESQNPIKIGDKKFVNKQKGQRATHQFAIALTNGKLSYPMIAFLDPTPSQLNVLTAVPGYKGPKSLEPILVFFGDEIYKDKKYKAFKKNFDSKLD